MSGGAQARRVIYIFIEGSIASGKSTALDRVVERVRAALGEDAHLVAVPEPVEAWRNVRGHNVLDLFYSDMRRYAKLFQTHALTTRVRALRRAVESAPSADPAAASRPLIVLVERSVYTDRHVFVELLHADGLLSDAERAVYEDDYDTFVELLYPGEHGGVVYLRTEPEGCKSRADARARGEESALTLDYLRALHAAHERVLLSDARPVRAWGDAPVLTVDVERAGNVATDAAVAAALGDTIAGFVRTALERGSEARGHD